MAFIRTTATKKIMAMKKRIRVIQGGSSASKTISIILYLIALAQSDKKRTLTSIVGESVPFLKRGPIRDFKNIMLDHNYWKDDCWNTTDSTYTFETGSQIEFFSTDNGEKLRGARRDRCFMNEANNNSFEAFEQLEIRTNEFVYLDYNPTNEFWVQTEIKGNRNDVDFIILTYKDNEALSDSIVKSLEQRKNRTGWWKVYGLGELGEIEGKIYKDWLIVDGIPHEAVLERYGIDFGYTNDPTSIVAVYRYNGGYILDEIAFQKGLSNKQIADIITNQETQALCIADSAEPKSIDELTAYGISVLGAEKGSDSVSNGIQIVQMQRISVTKRSINIIKEYRNYLWMIDKNGKVINQPEGGYDHTMDAIRYAITSIAKLSGMGDVISKQKDNWHRNRSNYQNNSNK